MSSLPPTNPKARPSPRATFAFRSATTGEVDAPFEEGDDTSKTASLSPEELAAAAADRAPSEGEVPQALDALIESLGAIRARLGADATRSTVTLGDERVDEALLELHASAREGEGAALLSLARAAGSLLGASRALVFRVAAGSADARPAAAWGDPEDASGGARQMFRKRLVSRALEGDGVVFVELLGERGQASEHATLLSLELSAALACAVCPRGTAGEAVAVLYVESSAASGRSIVLGARKLASRLAAHGGVALSNAGRARGSSG